MHAFICGWTLGSFHLWAPASDAVMIVGMQVSVWVPVSLFTRFLWHVPRGGIAASHVTSVFNYGTVLHSVVLFLADLETFVFLYKVPPVIIVRVCPPGKATWGILKGDFSRDCPALPPPSLSYLLLRWSTCIYSFLLVAGFLSSCVV